MTIETTPVAFACGHEQDLPLTGNAARIARKVAYLQPRRCHDCAQRQEALEAAEISRGWPALTGTRNQVQRGFRARARLIPGLQSALYEIGGHGVITARLKAMTEASWWLQRRFLTADRLLADVLADVEAAYVRRPILIPRQTAPEPRPAVVTVRKLELTGA